MLKFGKGGKGLVHQDRDVNRIERERPRSEGEGNELENEKGRRDVFTERNLD